MTTEMSGNFGPSDGGTSVTGGMPASGAFGEPF